MLPPWGAGEHSEAQNGWGASADQTLLVSGLAFRLLHLQFQNQCFSQVTGETKGKGRVFLTLSLEDDFCWPVTITVHL